MSPELWLKFSLATYGLETGIRLGRSLWSSAISSEQWTDRLGNNRPSQLKGHQWVRSFEAERVLVIFVLKFSYQPNKMVAQNEIHFFFLIFFICSEFCYTLEWNSHGFTCVPHPDPPSHLPVHLIPLGLPSAPGPSACLMHPTWAGDLFHPRYYTCFDAVLLKHPTLSFSHRVQKTVL